MVEKIDLLLFIYFSFFTALFDEFIFYCFCQQSKRKFFYRKRKTLVDYILVRFIHYNTRLLINNFKLSYLVVILTYSNQSEKRKREIISMIYSKSVELTTTTTVSFQIDYNSLICLFFTITLLYYCIIICSLTNNFHTCLINLMIYEYDSNMSNSNYILMFFSSYSQSQKVHIKFKLYICISLLFLHLILQIRRFDGI